MQTYRDNSFDARVSALEDFADGRAMCSGDLAISNIDKINNTLEFINVRAGIYHYVSWIFMIVLAVSVAILASTSRRQSEIVRDLHTQILMEQLELEELRTSLERISKHSEKLLESKIAIEQSAE